MLRWELEPSRAFLMLAHQDSGFIGSQEVLLGGPIILSYKSLLLFHPMAQGILPDPGRVLGDPW